MNIHLKLVHLSFVMMPLDTLVADGFDLYRLKRLYEQVWKSLRPYNSKDHHWPWSLYPELESFSAMTIKLFHMDKLNLNPFDPLANKIRDAKVGAAMCLCNPGGLVAPMMELAARTNIRLSGQNSMIRLDKAKRLCLSFVDILNVT